MRTTLLKAVIGILLYAHGGFAFERICSIEYGRPPLPDCLAALKRIPSSFKPIFFSSDPEAKGTIQCPFVISSGRRRPHHPLSLCGKQRECSPLPHNGRFD